MYSKEDLVLGLDIGYGDVKVTLGTKDGTIISNFKFTSKIGVTKHLEGVQNPTIIHYDENWYQIGEEARALPSANHINLEDYKNLEYFAPLLAYHAMKLAGILETGVSRIVSGLSIAQIQNSGYFQEALSHFVVNGKEFQNEVVLLPQGAGCKVCFDKYGCNFPSEQKDFTGTSSYVMVDIGFDTLDFVSVDQGIVTSSAFVGIEHSGIMKIATQMAKIVHDDHKRILSLADSREILNTGVYKLRGQKYDYTEKVKQLKEDYLKEILNLINEKFTDILDKCDFIVICGGGSSLFKDSQDGFIKVVRSKFEYYNSIGFYLHGLTA